MEKNKNVTADLRTAQNRMFPFIVDGMKQAEENGELYQVISNREKGQQVYREVSEQILELLQIPVKERDSWYLGVIDSGKRAIEELVNFFCPATEGDNVAVNTENYVAFNKFSAVNALHKQKGVSFMQPFKLKMGEALTIGSPDELERTKELFSQKNIKTLWMAWNSTSTGIRENVEKIVSMRNEYGSDALIISDAASLPLFSKEWETRNPANLPDVFFFSLRKQGLPYDGPQDEVNQAKNSGAIYLFNDRAGKRAKELSAQPLYSTPTPLEAMEFKLCKGEQYENHIKHLLKLKLALDKLLGDEGADLVKIDEKRKSIFHEINSAFSTDGSIGSRGFHLIAKKDAQSETAYIIKTPDWCKPSDVLNNLKEAGVLVSPSMHPELPHTSFLRFACYPATSLEETKEALKQFSSVG